MRNIISWFGSDAWLALAFVIVALLAIAPATRAEEVD